MEHLMHILGLLFIYIAVDYGRKGDSKRVFFSQDNLVIFILVTCGYLLIVN